MPQIWTQGETESSSAWFPTIDTPNQKTTSDDVNTFTESEKKISEKEEK